MYISELCYLKGILSAVRRRCSSTSNVCDYRLRWSWWCGQDMLPCWWSSKDKNKIEIGEAWCSGVEAIGRSKLTTSVLAYDDVLQAAPATITTSNNVVWEACSGSIGIRPVSLLSIVDLLWCWVGDLSFPMRLKPLSDFNTLAGLQIFDESSAPLRFLNLTRLLGSWLFASQGYHSLLQEEQPLTKIRVDFNNLR